MSEIDWNKEFPVTSIARADLKEADFTDARYWEDLEVATTMRLEFGKLSGGAS